MLGGWGWVVGEVVRMVGLGRGEVDRVVLKSFLVVSTTRLRCYALTHRIVTHEYVGPETWYVGL